MSGPSSDWAADRSRLDHLRAGGAALVRDWQARDDARGLRERLMRMDAALPPGVQAFAAELAPWLESDGWYRGLLERSCGAMSADPLADFPLGMQPGGMMRAIALVEAGGASATLALLSAEELRASARDDRRQALVFGGGYSVVSLLAGSIDVELWHRDGAAEHIVRGRSWTMHSGERMALDNQAEQMRILAAPRDAVILNMAVAGPPSGAVTLEFAVPGGALLRRGTADPAVSRMLALIELMPAAGAEGRCALLADLSEDAEPVLRWQAMRHCLAADVSGAMSRLTEMAGGDPDGAVRRAAQGTLALLAQRAGERAGAG